MIIFVPLFMMGSPESEQRMQTGSAVSTEGRQPGGLKNLPACWTGDRRSEFTMIF
jgi:hypothetical protein